MSISQIKRRFEQFEVYLGRDVQGLGKLKALKDAVNELRTSLAQSETRAAEQSKLAEEAAQRSREIARERDAATLELQRLQQVVRNLERDLRIAQATVLPAEADVTTGDGRTPELELKAALKRLRTRLKFCPKPTRMAGEHATYTPPGCKSKWIDVYDRDSLATGWSVDALWTLGASVALLAAMRGVAVIETKDLFNSVDQIYDVNSGESALRPAWQWYAKNNVDQVALSEAAERDCPGSTGGFHYVANQGGIGIVI